ncbi:hypothetical protein BDW02DRAFT_629223 [Decorospora gaudefroyi]|uniref:Uncharacterized protein n=1 Tax=Decorospora gaudefroyi TaxID=184978 RepID=A0A6A5KIM9_9PLEO|nr:hypothetical protein BDW02DRAFT_629223 [Decorospora gaudefroyi]
MAVNPFWESPTYTSPKRLPKKKHRPPLGALHAAARRLDLINSKISDYKVPAYIDLLSDDGEDPDIAAAELTAKRISARRQTLSSKQRAKRRPLVSDSEDTDTLSTNRARRSTTHIRQHTIGRDQSLSRNDSHASNTIDKRKTRHATQDLEAEIEDLEIDMVGWYELDARLGRPKRKVWRVVDTEDEAPLRKDGNGYLDCVLSLGGGSSDDKLDSEGRVRSAKRRRRQRVRGWRVR